MAVNSVGTAGYGYTSSYTGIKEAAKSGQTSVTDNSYTKAPAANTVINWYNDDNLTYRYSDVDIAKSKLYNRNEVNKDLKELLQKNGIQIPAGTSVIFSVEPYDFKLKVSGIKDEALASRIEAVLNSGENSKNLFAHIYSSSSGSDYVRSEQLQADRRNKQVLYLEVKNNTGYDLRDCICKDGTFYAQDGTDVIKEYMKGSAIPAQYRSDVTSYYVPRLQQLAREGFDNTEDLILQIEYKDGLLYDIGQKNGYGPGQTQWIDDLVARYGDELYVEPERGNTVDSGLPQIQELLKKTGIQLPEGLRLTFSFDPYTEALSILGTDDQDLIYRLQMLFEGKPARNLLYYLYQTKDHKHLDLFA